MWDLAASSGRRVYCKQHCQSAVDNRITRMSRCLLLNVWWWNLTALLQVPDTHFEYYYGTLITSNRSSLFFTEWTREPRQSYQVLSNHKRRRRTKEFQTSRYFYFFKWSVKYYSQFYYFCSTSVKGEEQPTGCFSFWINFLRKKKQKPLFPISVLW